MDPENTEYLLVPAALGAAGGVAYAASQDNLSLLSFAVGGTAIGLGTSLFMQEEEASPGKLLAFSAALLSIILVDHWIERMPLFQHSKAA